jgi:SAM-dependent methyltransferase
LPEIFEPHVEAFPRSGRALELACGQGAASVWLALRGLDVDGVDISSVAIRRARDLARRNGVDLRCRFVVGDLDRGLPDGAAADVILCHKFRDHRLDEQVIDRLAPDGLLAMCVCSEVGAGSGSFRATPGELVSRFAALNIFAAGEGQGLAWLLARKPGS